MNIVIINCFDTYEHRVDLLHRVFIEEGHKVKVLTSNFRHFEKVNRKESKTGFVFFQAEPYQKNLSFRRLHSHKKLSKDIFSYLDKQSDKVDLLWVLVPPNSFVKDASEYKQKHQATRLIFDLIDLWPETMPVGSIKNIFPFSVWKELRDKYLGCADEVVTECKLYQEKLKATLRGIKTETLYLARPLLPYRPNLNLTDNKISLCYLGSINNIIDINVIADVIKQLRRQKPIELHIVGDGERRKELITAAENSGANVTFHGKVYDRDEKQRIFDSCHYGLNIMKETVCVGLTMKSMDYMEFGLPMINNIKGDTWDLIESEKIGINYSKEISFIESSVEMRQNVRNYFERNLTIDVFDQKVKFIMDYDKSKATLQ